MATVLYVNPDQSKIAFGNALGCGWAPSVPPAYASVAHAPCVIVAGAGTVTVLADDGTLTAAKVDALVSPITAAELAAQAAANTLATNAATIQANITTHLGQLETWLAANPNGAVLTAAQTKFLAQMLVGVGRLMLGLTSTIGGAT